MSQIPLSVVVPTYNRKDNLRRTLDGLAKQTYPAPHFEVVVVSDGSTDGTHEFVTEYAKTAPYTLRLITQQNGGPARARNHGIQEARGTVVVFIDDDVEPTPDLLARHAHHHAESEKVAVIGPMVQAPDRVWKEPVWIAWEHTMLEKQYHALRNNLWGGVGANHFYSGNASVRREHLCAVNGFDEGFTRQEDVELAQRLVAQCHVHFVYDDAARGLHRPERTFASWMRIPLAYGQFDIQRAHRNPQNWEIVQHQAWSGRNHLHRLCMTLLFLTPAIAPLLRGMFLLTAKILYALRQRKPASAVLSLTYNLAYAEGAAKELGSWQKLKNQLRVVPPAA